MSEKIATLDELKAEGLKAYARGDKLIPVNNALVWGTIEAMNPVVGDPRTIEVFNAFESGWMQGQDDNLKSQGW